jgi:hypothetical protein
MWRSIILFHNVFIVFFTVKIVYICVFMTCSTCCCLCETLVDPWYMCVCVCKTFDLSRYSKQTVQRTGQSKFARKFL